MTLGQFQEIYKISRSDIDEEDKMTEMVAAMTGRTPNEVDSLSIPEFNQLAAQVKEALSKPLPDAKATPVINGHGITYEPAKLNRGQYVTLNHFLKGDVLENAHLILASVSYNPKTKQHEPDRHNEIAEALQSAPLEQVVAACLFFLSSLRDFNIGCGELFGQGTDEGDDESPRQGSDAESFDGRFGWLYNAKQVADFEGISLDECFEKDVTSFLNYLIYLKAYSSHQEKLMKNARNTNG